MIGTLIVDDDVEVLDGLARFIRWEEAGFAVVATAADGETALELVGRHRPGLLIADITMPAMDGLTLIREAKRQLPGLRTIILTCHEEFAYAQEAIHLGVMDYLLKITLTPEKLRSSLERIRAEIERDEGTTGVLESLRRELVSHRLFVQSEFFVTLIEGEGEEAERLLQRATLLGIGFPGTAFRAFVFFLDNRRIEPRERAVAHGDSTAVLEILSDAFGGEKAATLFSFSESVFILIRWYAAEPCAITGPFSGRVQGALKRIRQKAGLSASCCVSSTYTDVRELARALAECRALRDGYFYSGPGRIVSSPPRWETGLPPLPYQELAELLTRLLHSPDEAGIVGFMDRLGACVGEGRDPREARGLLSRLLVDVDSASSKRGFMLEHSLVDADTFGACRELFHSVLRLFQERSRAALVRSSREQINRVLAYIQGHLGETIKCETMAASVNLNPSYFSRLFKKEMGVSFTDYLMRLRIDRSMELLAGTRMSFEEITWAVGLENVSYFHRMFKRHTGSTPRQARNRGRSADPQKS